MNRIMRAGLLAALLLVSGFAFAGPCAGFNDVDDSSAFCQHVEWQKNRGVTLGCAAGAYCPSHNVDRLQMAIFMKRLGDALTTRKLFTDLNPGVVNIQNGNYGFVCPSQAYVPPFEQHAILHGNAWGLVDAPVTWSADLWYSTNGGANYYFISNFIPTFNATVAGMTSGSAFAQLALTPGTSYTFAILIRESIDVPAGPGNFTDLACHLMVEIGNYVAPPAAPPPCDERGPHLGCGDPRAGTARQPIGGLAGNLRP